jgi:hypothetical protein
MRFGILNKKGKTLPPKIEEKPVDSCTQDVLQKAISLSYKILESDKKEIMSLSDTGFRVFSQHDEDGILLFIFSIIGTVNKKCVEICAGNGMECNTANLIINHRWTALLMDGNKSNIEKATGFYKKNKNTQFWPPTIVHAWITKENINELILNNGFEGEVDLLSLDIDGNDYWIWKEIEVIKPRVVVLEYNHLLGPDKSLTVPYNPEFVAEFTQYGSDYAGASLAAFIKLGRSKGYRLVGTNTIGTNAFFVRNDIQHEWLPEISANACFSHPRSQFGMNIRWKNVENKQWEEV